MYLSSGVPRKAHYLRLSPLLAEVIDSKPDIIVVEGTVAALKIRQADLKIPVVMAVVGDPIASGLVESLGSTLRHHHRLVDDDVRHQYQASRIAERVHSSAQTSRRALGRQRAVA